MCSSKYCGIIWIQGGTIFVVLLGSPPLRINIVDENKFTKSCLSNWNWKPKHPWNYIPRNKQKPTIQENWPPTNLNESTVCVSMIFISRECIQFRKIWTPWVVCQYWPINRKIMHIDISINQISYFKHRTVY